MVIYLFDKLSIEDIIDMVMDYSFCKIKYDNKNRNIMFMYELNIQMDMKLNIIDQDNAFVHVIRSVICNCLSTRITNCQSISTLDFIMISHSS